MASLKVVFAVAACFAVLVLLDDVAVGVGAECEACEGSCDACKTKCDACQAEGDKICTSAIEGSGVCLAPAPLGKCSDNKDTTPDCEACKAEKKHECKKQYYKQMCVIREKVCTDV